MEKMSSFLFSAVVAAIMVALLIALLVFCYRIFQMSQLAKRYKSSGLKVLKSDQALKRALESNKSLMLVSFEGVVDPQTEAMPRTSISDWSSNLFDCVDGSVERSYRTPGTDNVENAPAVQVNIFEEDCKKDGNGLSGTLSTIVGNLNRSRCLPQVQRGMFFIVEKRLYTTNVHSQISLNDDFFKSLYQAISHREPVGPQYLEFVSEFTSRLTFNVRDFPEGCNYSQAYDLIQDHLRGSSFHNPHALMKHEGKKLLCLQSKVPLFFSDLEAVKEDGGKEPPQLVCAGSLSEGSEERGILGYTFSLLPFYPLSAAASEVIGDECMNTADRFAEKMEGFSVTMLVGTVVNSVA